MPNEIEIKFAVRDLRSLGQTVEQAGFRVITPRTHEMNLLFDFPGRPLGERGELLRLREYGGRWVLTHKAPGTAGKHKNRVEAETNVEDGAKLESILRSLGLGPVFRYEKFRTEYTDGTGHVVLDETPIGDYCEIEGPAEWIDQVAARLGIRETDYLTESYAVLFYQWKSRTGSAAADMTFAAVGPR